MSEPERGFRVSENGCVVEFVGSDDGVAHDFQLKSIYVCLTLF
jgi:hypothetical protein